MSADTTEGASVRVLVTGAGGLLGFHCRALLLAKNGERQFHGESPAYEVREASRDALQDAAALAELVRGCDIVLHAAGINRADPDEVEHGNPAIAAKLVVALVETGSRAHVVYADSTHADGDSPYGRGKRIAGELLAAWADEQGGRYSRVVFPHLFGEGGRPFYNTVTATLCHQVANGETPTLHDGAAVELLHASEAAELMLKCANARDGSTTRATGVPMEVAALYERILAIRESVECDLFPALGDELTLRLYNAYRFATFPSPSPRELEMNTDRRGELFEVARGGGGGQTFLSWTKPGVERGNHFHRRKVERFVVLQGTADIHVRRVFDSKVHSFAVSGDKPVAVDMPTLCTHSIVNTGSTPLLTLFWAHEIFDSSDPDTYMHPVDADEASIRQ